MLKKGSSLLNGLEKSDKSDNDEEDEADGDGEIDKIERKIKRSPYTIYPDSLVKSYFDMFTML